MSEPKKTQASTKHPQYIAKQWMWKMVRDANDGEGSIKRGNTMYLPMPSGMNNVDTSPSTGGLNRDDSSHILTAVTGDKSGEHAFVLSNPSYHSNPAYMAYKQRAHFPDITANTMRGLSGLAKRGNPQLKIPSSMEYLVDSATKDGKSLNEVYNTVVYNLLLQGRCSLLADVDEKSGEIKIVIVDAKSLINWKTDDNGLTMFVYEKEVVDPSGFSHDADVHYCVSRVSSLEEGGSVVYNVEIVDSEDDVIQPPTPPSFKGKALTKLPIVIGGSTEIKADVDIIPIQGVANNAVQMYQKSADLSMSEFMSCNPMLTLTGVADGEAPRTVGSTVMLTMENDNANAFYPATDTSALTHVMAHIDKLTEEAVSYGANLLGGSSKKAEAAETLKIRQHQNGATLLSVVDVAGEMMETILKTIAEWKGTESSQIEYEGNKEFSNIALSAQEQTALLQQWMANGISSLTYLWNLQQAGMLKGSVEDEIKELESQPPKQSMIPAPAKESAAEGEDDKQE